ncbi:MAG: hypothetical protein K2J63_12315 [Muribaculaceae bacterium]|nr:hypothetical protein [Muribaculaceae bacterium]MDE6796073.1 hypothetical protein [Muribaculaceae bacterium]
MAKTEKILYSLIKMDKGTHNVVPTVVMLILTVLYLVAVLSVPLHMPQKLIWLTAYPIYYLSYVASVILRFSSGHCGSFQF